MKSKKKEEQLKQLATFNIQSGFNYTSAIYRRCGLIARRCLESIEERPLV